MDIEALMTATPDANTIPLRGGHERGSVRGPQTEPRLPRAARGLTTIQCLAAASVVLSCGGPLPDTCEELGTCVAPDGTAPDANAVLAIGPDATADGGCDLAMDPKDDPCVLGTPYGVFVASATALGDGGGATDAGALPGDGSAQQPFATITQALANLGGRNRVYVCNGVYSEQVAIATAVSLYGGLSCPTGASGRVWSYVGQSAQVTPSSPGYALSVAGVDSGTVAIEDMTFASANATAAGGSSIAAFVASSTVDLRRVTLLAGDGADGADGANGDAHPNYTALAPQGGSQVMAGPDAGPTVSSGGVGGGNGCLGFGFSAGGSGGLGCGAAGLGYPGIAFPEPTVLAGRDGQPRGAIVDAGIVASANDPGADGVAGNAGKAAPALAYGTLSAAGWTPSAGGYGGTGDPGQGGAGATDPIYGMCGAREGYGGGGGGAGGCGGAGGQGGGGGGASIALASVSSTIDLSSCTLLAAAGGKGGAGGTGQDGQPGGPGGDVNSVPTHAPGAAGGNGAGGSGGAGGMGGISVDVLESGSAVTSDPATMQGSRLGAPGLGGAPGMAGHHGVGTALTTGMDGNAGAPGAPGAYVFLLEAM